MQIYTKNTKVGKNRCIFDPGMTQSFLKDALNFVFPRYCWICGDRLSTTDSHLCNGCLMNLPRTRYHVRPENPMEQLFWGCFDIQRASAFFFYHQNTPTSEILYHLKYGHCPEIGEYMGEIYAQEILIDNPLYFSDMNAMIPLPLNPKKLKIRGYNQCDAICKGLQQVNGLPVWDRVVERTVSNSTQTKKGRVERGLNVQGVFRLAPEQRTALQGKHLLLVDDVCTTGATLKSLASAFEGVPDLKISILTLGLASPVF